MEMPPGNASASPLPAPPLLTVALWAPRMPQNVGQIARTCHAMNVRLALIRPLGFRLDAPALRRAAVGWWEDLAPEVHADGDAFWSAVPDPARVALLTKHGKTELADAAFARGDTILLGNEDEGLPEAWRAEREAQTVRIAMRNPSARCLNLAAAATVAMFEALRKIGG